MSYVSKNYDNNPNAPMGSWVGIDSKGVPYSGTTTTDPKTDEEKDENAKLLEVATKAHKRFYSVNYEYGQCVSYVKAVTPGLPRTSEWKRGIKVSPGYHEKPVHPAVAAHAQVHRTPAIHHGAAHPGAVHGTAIHVAPPLQHPEPSMFQRIENALDLHLNLEHYEDKAHADYEHLLRLVQEEYHSFRNPAIPSASRGSSFSTPTIKAGTVIATFTKEGKYHGHAAIYEKLDDSGISVVNQWITGSNPLPVSRYTFAFRYGMGLNPTYVNDGDNYYVVE
ncbi:MAG: BPSL0067 family protein [Terracidiphilus sp.]